MDNPVRANRNGRTLCRQSSRAASRLTGLAAGFAAAGHVAAARHRDVGGALVAATDPAGAADWVVEVGGADSPFAAPSGRPSAGPPASRRISSWSEPSSRRYSSSSTPIGASRIWPSSAGFGGLDSAHGFAAALFSLLAIPTSLYAATRLAAIVADEQARHWTAVLSAPVSRIRLVCTEIAVVTAGVVVAACDSWTGDRSWRGNDRRTAYSRFSPVRRPEFGARLPG